MLVIMAGLPGTGKSTVAAALARETHAVVLDKDRIRAALFPPEFIEYTTEQDDLCVRVMLLAAGDILRQDASRVVVLDGRPFSKRYQLEQVVRFAEEIGTEWRILECTCSEETARRRLEQVCDHPARNRTAELYERIRSSWEEITFDKSVINTDRPLAVCIAQAREFLVASK